MPINPKLPLPSCDQSHPFRDFVEVQAPPADISAADQIAVRNAIVDSLSNSEPMPDWIRELATSHSWLDTQGHSLREGEEEGGVRGMERRMSLRGDRQTRNAGRLAGLLNRQFRFSRGRESRVDRIERMMQGGQEGAREPGNSRAQPTPPSSGPSGRRISPTPPFASFRALTALPPQEGQPSRARDASPWFENLVQSGGQGRGNQERSWLSTANGREVGTLGNIRRRRIVDPASPPGTFLTLPRAQLASSPESYSGNPRGPRPPPSPPLPPPIAPPSTGALRMLEGIEATEEPVLGPSQPQLPEGEGVPHNENMGETSNVASSFPVMRFQSDFLTNPIGDLSSLSLRERTRLQNLREAAENREAEMTDMASELNRSDEEGRNRFTQVSRDRILLLRNDESEEGQEEGERGRDQVEVEGRERRNSTREGTGTFQGATEFLRSHNQFYQRHGWPNDGLRPESTRILRRRDRSAGEEGVGANSSPFTEITDHFIEAARQRREEAGEDENGQNTQAGREEHVERFRAFTAHPRPLESLTSDLIASAAREQRLRTQTEQNRRGEVENSIIDDDPNYQAYWEAVQSGRIRRRSVRQNGISSYPRPLFPPSPQEAPSALQHPFSWSDSTRWALSAQARTDSIQDIATQVRPAYLRENTPSPLPVDRELWGELREGEEEEEEEVVEMEDEHEYEELIQESDADEELEEGEL